MASNGSQENGENSSGTPMEAIAAGPANSDVVVLPNQPRPPRDMRGLLRFAMEATAMEDAPHPSNFQPMDEERKKFLETALKAMTVDLVEVLTKALETLRKVKDLKADDDPEEYEAALETVADTVDNIDLANDYFKVGGFDVLLPCLSSPHESLQWRAAELIAELTQNNPYCQARILSAGFMPVLLMMIDDGSSETVRVKALYAVSCLIRDNSAGLEDFIKRDGFSVLLRAMQSDVEKLKLKSAFLLSALCSQHPEIRDELQSTGWVEQLVGLIGQERQPSHEHLLSALLALIREHPASLQDCRRPELQLRSMLTAYIESCAGKEECLEEVDYAQQIIKMVFTDDGADGER